MSIEYMIEAILLIGFMLSVLVVCKWFEDIQSALKESRQGSRSFWSILVRPHDQNGAKEIVEDGIPESSVVYLRVSNPAVPAKMSVRLHAEELVMKKAANSE